MIPEQVAEILKANGWKWKIGGELVFPTDSDISKALDEAVAMLYTERTGTQLEVGHLIIRKNTHDYDIFVHVGSFD